MINNCVGQNNLSHFLVYLMTLTLSCLYVLGLSMALLWRRRYNSSMDHAKCRMCNLPAAV